MSSIHRIVMQFRAAQKYKYIAPAQLKRIKTLTNRNYRSEAIVLGTQVLAEAAPLARGELQKLGEKAELVQKLHKLEGYMPESLSVYRDLAKESLPDDEYAAFAGCF